MEINNLLPQKVEWVKPAGKNERVIGPFQLIQVPDPPYGELVFIREDGACVPWNAVELYKIEIKEGKHG